MFRALSSPWRLQPLATLALAASAALAVTPVRAQALFDAGELVQERFVLVAAPIGTSDRYQLNIYEQITDRRPCYAFGPGLPSAVTPLLGSFDFTGICNRYIDANGYSLRIGGTDLATLYRLTVRNESGGTVLIASPAKDGAGPEMLVARSGGPISGFHRLQFEPGWKLMRRQFGGRRLGHVYIYAAATPGASPQPSDPVAAPASSALPAKPTSPAKAVAVPGSVTKPAAAAVAPVAGASRSLPTPPPAPGVAASKPKP